MRILWHSNHPAVKSGYGRQTADWVPRLAGLGHEIAVSGFHGVTGFMDTWTAANGRQFPVYPAGSVPYGNDVIGMHARHWRADLVIALMDSWILDTATLQYPSPRIPLACWMPVDCGRSGGKPWLGEYDHRRLNESRAFPIAMTRFGEQALADADFTPFYVPHGIDCDVYQPGDRTAIREAMGVQDRFVIVINSANRDKSNRKGFPEQIEAFRRFHGRHADALLILHTEEDSRLGISLRQMIDRMDITGAVRFSSQYMLSSGMIPETQLAGTYCAADLVSQASLAEGFGLPIAEAEACGTPTVVTQGSAMPEVAGPGGFVVRGEPSWAWGHDAWWMKPNIAELVRVYEKAYSGGAVYQAKKAAARPHILASYELGHVLATYWEPTLKKIEAAL